MRRRLLIVFTAFAAAALSQTSSQDTTYEGAPGVLLSNDKLQLTVTRLGGAIASVVMVDDPEKLNPMWNSVRIAREQGRTTQPSGQLGHFVAVDGFGQPSPEERAAGLPQHGEAHNLQMDVSVSQEGNGKAVTVTTKMPIVQEVFTRTFRMVPGENVIYVDSQLESLLGFDRPVQWAEHATLMAPFLKPGVTSFALSGTRAQVRPYGNPAPAAPAPVTTPPANGAAPPGAGRGGGPRRRLASGQDFTWPMAPGADGKTVNMSIVPDDPPYADNTATLMDPSRKLEFATALNTERKMVYGYIFRREDYPWLQTWLNYGAVPTMVRGIEFSSQPYDVNRHDTIDPGAMWSTPVYRWLRAKSKIESHFLLFFARVPDGFNKVDDVRLENNQIVIEDRTAQKRLTLVASRGIPVN